MAKIKIVGDAYVVESTQTLEAIKLLEKYNPKALCLYEADEDGKKQMVFRIASTQGGGNLNINGATFGAASHDERAVATITKCLPADVEDAKEYVEDAVGVAILRLNQVEEQFDAALEKVERERDAVRANIELG